METLLVLVATLTLAYFNGANDVSKGIATLVGSGVSSYRHAILWGTAWTALGTIAAAAFASAMARTFGSGLLAANVTPAFGPALAAIAGAALWVLVATRRGWPVSTTHAIVGACVGVAAVAYGPGSVEWSALGGQVVVPLLLSPVLAFGLCILLARWTRGRSAPQPVARSECLCVELAPLPEVSLSRTAGGAAPHAGGTTLRFTTGTSAECAVHRPATLRLRVDHLHWLTSGAASFARGMNDAPKIAGILLAASALTGDQSPVGWGLGFALIATGMVLGSVLGGLRVTRVLATEVTRLDHREGFLANLVTASLVVTGAVGGLPMSTTHVSAGAIIGIGAQRGAGELNRKTIRSMLLAWCVTLPASAALGVVLHLLIEGSRG